MKINHRLLLLIRFALLALIPLSGEAEVIDADVCIYGGTCAGIAAAVQTARMGKRVVLLEFGKHLGGLTTGGLGATDIGNKAAIGGIAREFYGRIAKYYAKDPGWTMEGREHFFSRHASGQAQASDISSPNASMWNFQPHV